jgi:hypothetical protein
MIVADKTDLRLLILDIIMISKIGQGQAALAL